MAAEAAAADAGGAEPVSDWRYWLVLGTWIVWDGYWFISARGVKRAVSKEPLISRIPVVIGLVLSALLMLAPGWFGPFFGQRFLPESDVIYFAGLALLLAGVYTAFWARHTLGTNWSGRVTIKEDHELVTHGPYRWVRHPIYSGLLLAVGGSTLTLDRIGGLVATLLIIGMCTYKLRLEEHMLDRHFGEAYAEYKLRTWALIPPLW